MLTLAAPNPLTPSHQPEIEASTCDLPSDWDKRSLEDLAAIGERYHWLQQNLASLQWKDFKLQKGKGFVERVLKIFHWWQKLSLEIRARLTNLPFSFVPSCGAAQLVKVPQSQLEECLGQLESKAEELDFLEPRILTQIAKQFIPVVKRHLTLGQTATESDWELVAKKFQLDPSRLEELKQQCSTDGEITTDVMVKCLSSQGLPLHKILAVKEFNQWTIEQLRVENERQSEEIAQLKAQLNLIYLENSEVEGQPIGSEGETDAELETQKCSSILGADFVDAIAQDQGENLDNDSPQTPETTTSVAIQEDETLDDLIAHSPLIAINSSGSDLKTFNQSHHNSSETGELAEEIVTNSSKTYQDPSGRRQTFPKGFG